jgi:Tol biopolymer transport system component
LGGGLEAMAMIAGTEIGPYEVLSPLGAGGMGEVWRAKDTRLNREVAIKVLPATFANDADRLRRFEQEALATSALNHPNILTVYDIGTHDGSPYLVSELLEGEELRDQLHRGPIALRKAIEYATQIAGGLAAAHAKAIVHRDLKPENIFVTTDGRVKILDFGLAKLRSQAPSTASGSDVQTQKAITDPGVVMGTVGYMSPEQVRGQDADHRADIFSFGAILHEMLTGRRAFLRETMAETMTAILREEPEEITQVNSKAPPQLERIVSRCLEKKPERRFQSTSDLCFAIEALSAPSTTSGRNQAAMDAAAAAKRTALRDRLPWIVAAVCALIALALAVAYFSRSASEGRAVRLAFAPPENLAFDNGLYDSVIVSPDGRTVAFTGRSADGTRQLWARSLDAMEAQPLPGTNDPLTPFWSPDSRSIGFGSQGKLRRVELAGGRPQVLCDAPRLQGGSWSRSGVIVFSPNTGGGLFQIPAAGGTPTAVTDPDRSRGENELRDPSFLPDGRHFLYRVLGAGREKRTFSGSLDSKDVKQVLADDAPAVYAPPGWLLFVRNGALMAQSFDAGSRELKGEALQMTPPTNDVSVSGIPMSVSDNGVLIWQGDRQREYQLVWFDRQGKQLGVSGPPMKVSIGQAPGLSPDDKRIVIHRVDPQSQNQDIWVIDIARDLPTRLTSDPATEQLPIWSPDGDYIVFDAIRSGVRGLYKKPASGGSEELLLQGGPNAVGDWSPDGRLILFGRTVVSTRRDVFVLPLFGDRQPYPILDSQFDEYREQFSPNGRWLAFVSDESGTYEVYLQSFTADGRLAGAKLRISTNGGNQPRFRRDGKELFYVAADGQMMAVALNTSGAMLEPGTPNPLFRTRMLTGMIQSANEYDVTADGQRFVIGTVNEANSTPVIVMLNWQKN